MLTYIKLYMVSVGKKMHMTILGVKNLPLFLQRCGGVTKNLRYCMINQTFDDSLNEYQI